MQEVWEIFSEELYICNKIHDLKVHSFVLMSNHFHLAVSTPLSNIDKCMHYLMSATSHRLTRAGNRINGTFAGRYYKTILDSHIYYLNAYKYAYHNPVRARIVDSVLDYRFSTLRGLLGMEHLLIPIEEDLTLFSDVEATLRWLDERPDSQKWEAVRYGLKRPYFRVKTCRRTRAPLLKADEKI